LLENIRDETERQSLEFAKTIFGPLAPSVKIRFLVEDSNRFDLLEVWSPGDARQRLRLLACKDKSHSATVWAEFLAAARMIVEAEGATEAIGHPIVKSVVTDFANMVKIAKGRGDQISQLVDRLFFDVCAAKLGVKAVLEPECPDLAADDAPQAKALAEVLGANGRKLCEVRRGNPYVGAFGGVSWGVLDVSLGRVGASGCNL
jgi:hypothetical protein